MVRVVLVNWARIWDGASCGGGVNGYVRALALELTGRGHDVMSVCAGISYDAEGGSPPPGPCRTLRHPDWRDIRVFEIVNSPVLAPSLAQFADPLGEVSAPHLEADARSLLKRLAPDVVHFHNLEGFSIGVVDAARALPSRPRIIFSLHNYHTICPQVCLMQGHRLPCHSFENGHRCTTCVPTLDTTEERLFRAVTAYRMGSGDPHDDGAFPVLTDDDASRRAFIDGADVRGEVAAIRHDDRLWASVDPLDPQWEPLENVANPEPASDEPPNNYAHRRLAMVSMLSRCDRVLAVSRFVERKFLAMGVDRDVLTTLTIGSPMTEVARGTRPNDDRSRPVDASDEVRLAFLGYNNWYKGLPLLAAALELLGDDRLSLIHLSVFAIGGEDAAYRFERVRPRLAGSTFVQGYDYHDIPRLLSSIDIGVVPSTWWDNAPQTVMEFLACGVPVLGANVGGIPDFVQHGVNGWLFRANDPQDLARRLGEIVSNPCALAEIQKGVQAPKSMNEHVAELEQIYGG